MQFNISYHQGTIRNYEDFQKTEKILASLEEVNRLYSDDFCNSSLTFLDINATTFQDLKALRSILTHPRRIAHLIVTNESVFSVNGSSPQRVIDELEQAGVSIVYSDYAYYFVDQDEDYFQADAE